MSAAREVIHRILVYDTSDTRYSCEGATGVCYSGRKRTFIFSLPEAIPLKERVRHGLTKDSLPVLDGLKCPEDRELARRFLSKVYRCIADSSEPAIQEELLVGGTKQLDVRELIALPHVIDNASNIEVLKEGAGSDLEIFL